MYLGQYKYRKILCSLNTALALLAVLLIQKTGLTPTFDNPR